MKTGVGTFGGEQRRWVGDGFPVRSLFSYPNFGPEISPFLLLDYAGPHEFDEIKQAMADLRSGRFGKLPA